MPANKIKTYAIAIFATISVAATGSSAFAERSGQEQLQRLLSPHTNYIRVSQAAKDATGDPNITVIDRRGRSGEVYQCSFLNRYGRRIMVCD